MKRVSAVIALIVLLLVPLTWWRGQTYAHGVALVSPAGNLHAVGLHRGRLMLFTSGISVHSPGNAGLAPVTSRADLFDDVVEPLQSGDVTRLRRLGVTITTGDGRVPNIALAGPRALTVVPPWIICLAAGAVLVAPTLRRRVPPGHCHACGYDLRASGDVCPECGTGCTSERMLAAGAASDML